MAERFKKLPKVVQDAITSADVEKHLRELADTHKLHIDQWSSLESEVQLALLGFQPVEDLAKNIESEVGVTSEVAAALAGDISRVVFEPVRHELERELEHPEAQNTETPAESVRGQQPAAAPTASAPAATPIAPATPPQAAPDGTAIRAEAPESYAAKPSHERKEIIGDPYREQIA